MEDLIPVVVGAAMGAIVTAAGWFVTERFYHQRLRKEATLRHIERQIEELYGPLLGLVRYSESVYHVAAAVLPSVDDKHEAVDLPAFTDQNWETWRFLGETYFHPTNARVRELVLSKTHLLMSDQRPSSLEDFLDHAAHFECRERLAKEWNVDTKGLPGPGYPRGFRKELEDALRDLQTQHEACLRSLGSAKGTSGG